MSTNAPEFLPTTEERFTLKHEAIGGYAHTIAYLIRLNGKHWRLRLMCTKSECKRDPQHRHEIDLEVTEEQAKLWLKYSPEYHDILN